MYLHFELFLSSLLVVTVDVDAVDVDVDAGVTVSFITTTVVVSLSTTGVLLAGVTGISGIPGVVSSTLSATLITIDLVIVTSFPLASFAITVISYLPASLDANSNLFSVE